jgi:biofilm PGA synthesis N-glycosyltransferase PgaC
MQTNTLIEPKSSSGKAKGFCPLTVIIPAYNEAKSLADTIQSVLDQTVSVAEIVVVDDCSTDNTSQVASALGVKVLRPSKNTGSKAGAQNFALLSTQTEFTMAIDADTVLAKDAIEKLMPAFDDSKVVAACGFVIPRRVTTLWERGRYIGYPCGTWKSILRRSAVFDNSPGSV